MNRINRYVLRHLASSTLVAAAALTFAIWLTQSLRLLEVIIDGAAPIGLFFRMVMLIMPEFVVTVLPVAFVAAVLFTYYRLTVDSELVVLRSCGLGPIGLARPAAIMAIAVMGASYALNLYLWPLAAQEFRRLTFLVESEYATVLLREGQFNAIDDSITVFMRERLETDELQGILIHDRRDPASAVTVVAERGILTQTETGPRVVMFTGHRQVMARETGQLETLYFDQYAIDLQVVRPDLAQHWPEASERYLPDLLRPDLSWPNDVPMYRVLVAEGHSRLSRPLWILAFAAVALGLLISGEGGRRGQGRRVTAAIGIIIVLQAVAMGLIASARDLPAIIPLLYAAPLAAAAGGIALLFRRPRGDPAAWRDALANSPA